MERSELYSVFWFCMIVIFVTVFSYATGRYFGYESGQRAGRESVCSFLEMTRHDIQQSAKFADSAKSQDEMLKYAGAITQVLELLGQKGE